jgi:3-oxoacyl-[acyl-carrier protein] reductase
MSDFLVDLGANPAARNIIGKLGLPIPLPQKLRRGRGPWEERPLADRRFVVGAVGDGAALPTIAATLARAGASITLVGAEDEAAAPFVQAGEAWGRPLRRHGVDDEVPRDKVGGLIFDATGIETAAQLRGLYDFFHPWIKSVDRCGRVVVLGRPVGGEKTEGAAAASRALEGFVRSAAKELGRKGATANLVRVAAGAEDRLEGPLRFVLSSRSAFVDGQPLHVDGSTKPPKKGTKVSWIRPLEGKAALVTGAARGIGKATVQRLAAEGAKVICLDLPADDGAIAAIAMEVGGVPLPLDVTAPDAGAKIAAVAKEAFGGLDIVVHNAGITRDKTLGRMKPENWDLTLQVNLTAILAMDEELLKVLRPGGRMVLLSSIAGIAGNLGQTNYATSKAAIIGLVRHRAGRLAKKGITVNAVAPGFVETRLTAAIPTGTREAARRLSALSQGGLPVDIAEVVTFFASPGALGVTGNVLRACGGSFIGA